MLPVDNLYQWAPWSTYAAEMGVEQPQNSLISDLIIQNYAWKRFLRDSLAAGRNPAVEPLPLWRRAVPGHRTKQLPTIHLRCCFLVLPLPKAYGWYALSQLWLAGLSTFSSCACSVCGGAAVSWAG